LRDKKKRVEARDDAVIVSYSVGGNTLYKRKLLYNAVTRAKINAIIIVQNRTRRRDPPINRQGNTRHRLSTSRAPH
jgi:hypothetical protein